MISANKVFSGIALGLAGIGTVVSSSRVESDVAWHYAVASESQDFNDLQQEPPADVFGANMGFQKHEIPQIYAEPGPMKNWESMIPEQGHDPQFTLNQDLSTIREVGTQQYDQMTNPLDNTLGY